MPDIDPRLKACADAVGPLLAAGSPVSIARAVVDTWLQQQPTAAMNQAAAKHADPDSSSSVYVQMCGAARREIAGE